MTTASAAGTPLPAMMTLIRNGTVVTASDLTPGDVLVEDETVVAIFVPGTEVDADVVLDAKGKLVLPGGIDVHTHLDAPVGGTVSSDDFESGTIAAACGGTTTIVDYATPAKGGTLRAALEAWHAKAEGKAAVDYGFHAIVREATAPVLEEMAEVVREGVTSFKVFMAYPGVFMLDDESISRVLARAREVGGLVCVHAEAGASIEQLVGRARAEGHKEPWFHALTRPPFTEGEATGRAIALARDAGAPLYVVHVTCADALERIIEARDDGLPVRAETCPQYLFCSDEDLERPDFAGAGFVCSPPLREKVHQEELWKGLATGAVQVVATDHCSFLMKGQKDLGIDDFTKIPNGMPGIETRLHLLHDGVREGRISLNRFVDATATAPAKTFGLYPRKGTVAVGSDADLVVWDPKKEVTLSHETLHMRVDYSPYEGRKVVGAPSHVLLRGEVVVDQGRFVGRPGQGRFLRRSGPS